MRNSLFAWVLLFSWGVCALLVGVSFIPEGPDDLEQQQALYCEMVETYTTTGGEYGWPDYKGTAQRYCR